MFDHFVGRNVGALCKAYTEANRKLKYLFSFQPLLTPWFGAKIYAKLALSLGFADAGAILTGYVMETQIPIRVVVGFSKMPIYIS